MTARYPRNVSVAVATLDACLVDLASRYTTTMNLEQAFSRTIDKICQQALLFSNEFHPNPLEDDAPLPVEFLADARVMFCPTSQQLEIRRFYAALGSTRPEVELYIQVKVLCLQAMETMGWIQIAGLAVYNVLTAFKHRSIAFATSSAMPTGGLTYIPPDLMNVRIPRPPLPRTDLPTRNLWPGADRARRRDDQARQNESV